MKMPKLGFQSDDPEWRAIELHFFLEPRVRCMIARENFDCSIGDSLQQRIDMLRASEAADSFCSSYRNSESPHPSARCDADKFRR